MKIILLDARANFRNDIRNRLLIDDERDIELLTDLSSSSGLETAINRYHPDYVVVADNVYNERSNWTAIGIPVVGYISKRGNPNVFSRDGVPAYACVETASQLLNLLEAGMPEASTSMRANDLHESGSPRGNVGHTEPPVSSQVTSSAANSKPVHFNAPIDLIDGDPDERLPGYRQAARNNHVKPRATTQTPNNNAPITGKPNENNDGQSAYIPAENHTQQMSVKERLNEERRSRMLEDPYGAIQEDVSPQKMKTKTVAVYAAKGGVGKTTIATELAVMLSLVSQGRSNLRVCLIDYNIDFGDVLTTLDLNNRGPNLSHWAAEIRRRIAAGESENEIVYSAFDIENRLQRFKNSSLYALVAPIAHEDSMEIESNELNIILKNIVNNGQFDFVICDTGNNTRDSTVIALEAADEVLLIATQDVSAVNCDQSFLKTMIKIGFDTEKIRLIVNNIMPYKYTQVAVKEVETMFSYPCIARFKRDPDVTKANNMSEPIVYQPNHEFTKEMRKVVAYLTGQKIAGDSKKEGFFASLFRRKGD